MNVDIATMTDAELDALRLQIWEEQQRRLVIANAPSTMGDLQAAYVAALGRVDGAAWLSPTMALDVYGIGSTVTHNGKTWVSTIANNVWEPGPGGAGWRELVGPGQLAEWVQPSSAADAYSFGDRVKYNGHKWTNTNPGTNTNTWAPNIYGWADDGPV